MVRLQGVGTLCVLSRQVLFGYPAWATSQHRWFRDGLRAHTPSKSSSSSLNLALVFPRFVSIIPVSSRRCYSAVWLVCLVGGKKSSSLTFGQAEHPLQLRSRSMHLPKAPSPGGSVLDSCLFRQITAEGSGHLRALLVTSRLLPDPQ